jgi:quaternary ammonium compound-resistance protein SugE
VRGRVLTWPWLALLLAGGLEVAWAAGFKFAFKGDHWITAGVLAAMAGSFTLLYEAMKAIPVGTAYAVWTGVGAAGAAIIGIIWLKEPATALRIASIAMIVGGVIGLKISSLV